MPLLKTILKGALEEEMMIRWGPAASGQQKGNRALATASTNETWPPSPRSMVRITKASQRRSQELRPRTQPLSRFNNKASCQRSIYALFSRLNRNWKGK